MKFDHWDHANLVLLAYGQKNGEFKISLKPCVEDSPKANIQMLIFVLVIPIHVVIVLKMSIIQEAVLHHAKFAKKVDIIIYIVKTKRMFR
jgi:hypothetical protein